MAQAPPLNLLEPGCPIQVEHDRKRRQFTVRLNGWIKMDKQFKNHMPIRRPLV